MIDLNIIGIGADTSEVRTANKDLDGFGKSADKASRQADGLTGSVASMAKGFLGLSAGIAAASKLVSVTDEYTKYTAILRNATSGQGEFNAALADIRRIANTAQTDVAGLATTYARFSGSLKEFGASQKQIATLTETVALGLKANGASAMETTSVMLQLSQAFGAGKLSGDEFRSMAEAAPNLMRALAASIGVPTGALKEMAAQGQLTNDVLLKAFTDPALVASLKSQASDIKTMSGAWQQLKNEIETSFAALESATGFFKSLAISTAQLAQGIGIIRGWFQGDTIAGLNEELKKATDMLAAFDRGNAFDKAIMGGQKRRAEMLADIERLRKSLYELNKKPEVNPASLSTRAQADKEWMDKETKKYQDELDKRNKKAADNAATLAELQQDIYIEFHQDERKRIEKTEEYKRNLYDETLQEEFKALEEKEKKAKKFADYQNKLEQELNGQIKKFNDMQDDAQYDAIKKRAEAYKKEYDRIGETVSRSLTDALMRGFESGKSFAQNFIDTLKNMFATLVLRPAIEFILNGSGITGALAGLGGLFSGNASASTGGVSGGVSSGVSLVKGIVNGFDGINATFQSSIDSLGASLAESNFGLIKSLGGMIGQYSGQIANIAPYAGAALQLLSGNVKGAAFTGVGTAIGSYFGGPVGGAIGSAVGSFVGSLFGGGDYDRFGTNVFSKFSGGKTTTTGTGVIYDKPLAGTKTALESLNDSFAKALDSILSAFDQSVDLKINSALYQRSSKAGGFLAVSGFGGRIANVMQEGSIKEIYNALVNQVFGKGLVKAIQASDLPSDIKALFKGLTDKTTVQSMLTAVIGLTQASDALSSRFGLSAELAAKVANATGLAGDELAAFVATLSSSALATQKASISMIKERDALDDLIGSLPASVDAFDAILKSIDTTTSEGASQFAELFKWRERFASYTSSFDTVVGNVESAIYGMLSPSEKLALDQANLAAAFGELNIAVPGSIQELINLGNSIDYTTESGLDLALAFPALVEMFGKTQDAVNALTDDLSANYFSTLADFRSAQVSDSPQSYIKNQTQINADLLAEIKAMKEDGAQQKAVLLTVAEYTFKQSRVLDDWDANGMPAERTV